MNATSTLAGGSREVASSPSVLSYKPSVKSVFFYIYATPSVKSVVPLPLPPEVDKSLGPYYVVSKSSSGGSTTESKLAALDRGLPSCHAWGCARRSGVKTTCAFSGSAPCSS